MINRKLKGLLVVSCLVLILSAVLPIFRVQVHAAVPSLENIRVTLFISTRGSVPAVTFQSKGAMEIGLRQGESTSKWTSSSQAFRLSADQFMIKAWETSDLQQAAAAQTKLKAYVPEAFLFSSSKQGTTVYSLYAGMYATEQAAENAKSLLAQKADLQGYDFQITGANRLLAGTYASIEEAKSRLAAITNAGLSGAIALHPNAEGKIVYSVLVGEAANDTQLSQLHASLAEKLPGEAVQAWNAAQPYLLLRTSVDAQAAVTVHYFFNAANQKVWIAPTDTSLTVKERYNRSYRGNMEVSVFEGQLAVINELPFEHYLYSVVGTEMSGSWPLEALKAQAVAARTFALSLGTKYQIAHISDTTYDQAYYGNTRETTSTIQAVDDTKGVVLVDGSGQLINPLYSSNAGGMTAEPTEVWGNDVPYLESTPSPDSAPGEGLLDWYRVVLSDGTTGFIRSDLLRDTGKENAVGFPIYQPTDNNVNVRPAPYVPYIQNDNTPVALVNASDQLTVIETVKESNVYNWVRGPYTADEMLSVINRTANSDISGPLRSLTVSERGTSGRVIEMKANGQKIDVSYPDQYRSVMNGLLSTRFEVEETGRYTVVGRDGAVTEFYGNSSLYAVGPSGNTESISGRDVIAVNEQLEARVYSPQVAFRFIGYGFGHGLGMSQYGAKELAEFMGYDYKEILEYYYKGIKLVK
ncbi:SpoIID/LytB domain-containing protein [Marinicrinis lubricantis]|uniref:SpoIID/LytB domain-containing protein n=1 Tax=Marinicrinis lubricantis TaxID=2086470 RepID=A0ABW1IU51_9BACL